MKMVKKKKTIDLQSLLLIQAFLLANIAYFCKSVIWLKALIPFCEIVSLFSLIFLCLDSKKWIKIHKHKLFLIIAMLISGIITYAINSETILLYYALLTVSIGQIKNNTIYKYDFVAKIIVFAIVIISSQLGLTDAAEYSRNGQIRETFGFSHPNSLGFIVVALFSDLILGIKNTNTQKLHITIALAICIVVLLFADSRAAILVVVFMYIFSMVKNIRLPKIIIIVPILLILLSIISTFLYEQGFSLFVAINEMLSSRLNLQSYYLSNYEITLFGTNSITYIGHPLDNAYIKTLMNTGITGLSLIALYGTYSLSLLFKKQNNKEVLHYSIFLIYALSEMIALRPIVSVALIAKNKETDGEK